MENNKIYKNNYVQLIGKLGTPNFSHNVYGENFYDVPINVSRDSGVIDTIILHISDRLVQIDSLDGNTAKVIGCYRSFNKKDDEGYKHLITTVLVKEIEESEDAFSNNTIELNGTLVKKPNFRKTKLGREITDFLIAVNRSYGKSDYIPCICWSRNARYLANFDIGDYVSLQGRIQSREYIKYVEDQQEFHTCYEVSCSKLEVTAKEYNITKEIFEEYLRTSIRLSKEDELGTVPSAKEVSYNCSLSFEVCNHIINNYDEYSNKFCNFN